MAEKRKVPTVCKEIGHRIALLRQKAGRTQEKMAEDIGADASYVARIETGQRQPSIEILDRIANSLGVPLGHLFGAQGSGFKLTSGEKAWSRQAKRLNDLIEKLGSDDIKILIQVANRLVRK